jgi:hypothetical protein
LGSAVAFSAIGCALASAAGLATGFAPAPEDSLGTLVQAQKTAKHGKSRNNRFIGFSYGGTNYAIPPPPEA